ncbi:uncharacterized protein LDX57_004698 [Aspergillus melleus]|uniref:uncharacterized protein n=1 Tax=Aspergillus melleus TaxID=138277 RepID=UPI001E8EDB9B|nr:uncharacterized protein LDX57_004698 [Aspergillus melleus]KAH8426974.1 hypothetical protein LDX57_004698 [Aspergillus melleus]
MAGNITVVVKRRIPVGDTDYRGGSASNTTQLKDAPTDAWQLNLKLGLLRGVFPYLRTRQ